MKKSFIIDQCQLSDWYADKIEEQHVNIDSEAWQAVVEEFGLPKISQALKNMCRKKKGNINISLSSICNSLESLNAEYKKRRPRTFYIQWCKQKRGEKSDADADTEHPTSADHKSGGFYRMPMWGASAEWVNLQMRPSAMMLFYLYLLPRVNYADNSPKEGLPRGYVSFSVSQIANELNQPGVCKITPGVVRNDLDFLYSNNLIKKENSGENSRSKLPSKLSTNSQANFGANRFTVVSVCNYGKYNGIQEGEKQTQKQTPKQTLNKLKNNTNRIYIENNKESIKESFENILTEHQIEVEAQLREGYPNVTTNTNTVPVDVLCYERLCKEYDKSIVDDMLEKLNNEAGLRRGVDNLTLKLEDLCKREWRASQHDKKH